MAVSLSPQELVIRVDEAFRERDLDGIVACYEDDATMVVTPGTLARGASEIRQAFTRILAAFERRPDVRHEKRNVIETGDIALFSSRWTLYVGTTPLMTRYATSVLRCHPTAGWRLVVDNAHGPAPLLDEAPAP